MGGSPGEFRDSALCHCRIDPPPHAGVGRPWGTARRAEAEASMDGAADLARLGDKAADVH